jgi:hypothetical protein
VRFDPSGKMLISLNSAEISLRLVVVLLPALLLVCLLIFFLVCPLILSSSAGEFAARLVNGEVGSCVFDLFI